MSLDVCTIPALDIEELKKDERLRVEEGLITYEDSSIVCYSEETVQRYFKLTEGSNKVLKYLAETYDVLYAADGFLDDAYFFAHMDTEDEEEFEFFLTEYAAREMYKHNDYYGLSFETLVKVQDKRAANQVAFENYVNSKRNQL